MTGISIHAPREGSDFSQCSHTSRFGQFLSTLPARGATCTHTRGFYYAHYFYPRSPRGERRFVIWVLLPMSTPFLSTLPARGATAAPPLELTDRRFLSTLPARGATIHERRNGTSVQFLSTLPARGATAHKDEILAGKGISIHAPREGSDGGNCAFLPAY